MTVITVRHPDGLFTREQRRELSMSLTDAVLIVECGKVTSFARFGFQVHFQPFGRDHAAIGGVLADEHPGTVDPVIIDIAVMDAGWSREARGQVIRNVFNALCVALGVDTAPPTWWINFRVIDDGSWGSSGDVLSILDLVDMDAFTPDRAASIHAAFGRSSPGMIR